jgi:hypothetical protein
VPQLIRHVQVFYQAMLKARTGAYVKIGTSGTGGMGLNIPYTHSEEKPSRVLLSKSALAGAHTLLLFLMARTPGGPITKEIKPAAAIAWKRIGYGEVLRGGNAVPLFDATPPLELRAGQTFRSRDEAAGRDTAGAATGFDARSSGRTIERQNRNDGGAPICARRRFVRHRCVWARFVGDRTVDRKWV